MITLANMILTDEDALICDMAETYGVFDMYALEPQLCATLAIGLRDNSRIKTKMMGMEMMFEDYLLASIYDLLNWICWTHTKDATHGTNQPRRLVDILTKKEEKQTSDILGFNTAEEFEAERARILRG